MEVLDISSPPTPQIRYTSVPVPDGVPGALAVHPAVLVQDDVGLQVPVVVMSRVIVGDDPGRDAQTAQDWEGDGTWRLRRSLL